MSDQIAFPREVWVGRPKDGEFGGVCVFSEHATIPRWPGDSDRDRDFNCYVDRDIFDSQEKYTQTMREGFEQTIHKLKAALEEIACRHVTDQPLWWQEKARAAISLASKTDQTPGVE